MKNARTLSLCVAAAAGGPAIVTGQTTLTRSDMTKF